LPKNQSYIENQHFRELLSSQRAGSANVSELKLGKCMPQNFNIAWRRVKTLDTEEMMWVSLASASNHTNTEHLRKTSNMQHFLPYSMPDSK
jgi:hypothetical protein